MNSLLKTLTLSSLVLLSACASQTGWTPTVDPYTPQNNPYSTQNYPEQRYNPPNNPQYNAQPPTYNQQPPYNPNYVPPQYSNEQLANRYYRDLAECKQLASQASGGTPTETAKGAGIGALLGAAGGAVIGAIAGNAGEGAAIGAVVGGVGGGARQGIQAEGVYKQAYSNCMRNRGHNVVD